MSMLPMLTVAIGQEPDIVSARRRARQIARLLGFVDQDGTRIATAVSEITRNAHAYGHSGKAEFLVDTESPQALVIRVTDRGPGIADVEAVLSGRTESASGRGVGIVGARRLVDEFEMISKPGVGTTVILRKYLPASAQAITPKSLAALTGQLVKEPQDLYEELRLQNQELLDTLELLRSREEDLSRLNRELEDTNRGVVALYGELDQRAEQLRYADQMKSRFLSHMSHEFRTPLNSIVGLTRLLLKRKAVNDHEEIKREITFVQEAAQNLTDMVDDLLDLAKAESGKLSVEPTEFGVQPLFNTLRAMMRPLATNEEVELIFDEPAGIPVLRTDENKLSQILRNLLSNALKFTVRGQVRVDAHYDGASDMVTFSVQDTGIGIPPQFHRKVFEEFGQVDSPIQRRVRGTGLGLPLCKRLSELLGGSIELESQVGVGSRFTATIPRVHRTAPNDPALASTGEPHRRVLLVDDEEMSRYLLRQLLGNFEFFEAASASEALRLVEKVRPDIIFLDLGMPDMTGFELLARLKGAPETQDIPVVIVTGQRLEPNAAADLANHAAAVIFKQTLARAEAITVSFGPPVSILPRYRG